jgi:hypothetical protein
VLARAGQCAQGPAWLARLGSLAASNGAGEQGGARAVPRLGNERARASRGSALGLGRRA